MTSRETTSGNTTTIYDAGGRLLGTADDDLPQKITFGELRASGVRRAA